MQKLLLMSIMFAMIGVPFVTAGERSAMRALKRMLILWVSFAMFYLVAMRFVYPYLA